MSQKNNIEEIQEFPEQSTFNEDDMSKIVETEDNENENENN